MNKLFLTRLALSNLRKNAKTYLPFFISCVGIIMMFYNMAYLRLAENIGTLSDNFSLRLVLAFGTIIIGIFSVIFLIYINSFLIKRRKKEFGLYNVLGLEKKHIAKVMGIETLIISISSILSGLFVGILFSKIFILLLMKIMQYNIPFGFEVSIEAISITCTVFGGIFLWNVIYNTIQVYKSKPIELLMGGKVGEKEPKSKWILGLIGAVCLIVGYYISITVKSPIEAILIFFIAVLLVIIGTYSLFTCVSILVLKLLKKNKKFYYQPKHFTTISGMMYRMKQNAVGLANICILSTMVIVTVSTTVCLYIGIEDILNNRYPTDIAVLSYNATQEEITQIDHVIEEQMLFFDTKPIDESKITTLTFFSKKVGNQFIPEETLDTGDVNSCLSLMLLDDYNHQQGTSLTLNEDEIFVFSYRGEMLQGSIEIGSHTYSIKDEVKVGYAGDEVAAVMYDVYYIIFSSKAQLEKHIISTQRPIMYGHYFNLDTPVQTKLNMIDNLNTSLKGVAKVEGKEYFRSEFYQMYGGLFFIGLLLGTVFLMATILIIYYKQIAESYEDKEKYEIMRKVGMSHKETKQSINSQVMTVFFIPIIVASLHIVFAFPLIKMILLVFNLTNIKLFMLCVASTIFVFFLFYAIVYKLSTNTYYKNITE